MPFTRFFAMFKALFGSSVNKDLAHALYGAVVARSRDPRFYSHFGVPDTLDGRFELLVMHLYVLHDRLKNEKRMIRAVSQYVFDAFIDDMDAALREAGVGDQTVPKKIAKMTKVFYGRVGAYEVALLSQDRVGALQEVIARNLYPDGDAECRAALLSVYMAGEVHNLADRDAEQIVQQADLYQGPLPERLTDDR